MTDKDKITAFSAIIILSILIGFIAGGTFGSYSSIINLQKEAIKAGHGEYNSETGKFQWRQLNEPT